MEDLIHCTLGRRRSSISSQGSSPHGTPLVSVSHYDPYAQKQEYAGASYQALGENTDSTMAVALAKRFYQVLPGIDVADWSWLEFAKFVLTCILLGFMLPAIRYAIW
ncbi:hypothetical protein LPJ66_011894 [Kickxella alabastrina]|uniref:Uncharacterized protein n=1 Tax=Kickxella alabastrina TaxID=61397 RepID=A0ACC1HWE7_9FUNG|nr:hypothetical protein LPJ66_011894 [Kickxella alabastrina]